MLIIIAGGIVSVRVSDSVSVSVSSSSSSSSSSNLVGGRRRHHFIPKSTPIIPHLLHLLRPGPRKPPRKALANIAIAVVFFALAPLTLVNLPDSLDYVLTASQEGGVR